jgi:hypothetical protein
LTNLNLNGKTTLIVINVYKHFGEFMKKNFRSIGILAVTVSIFLSQGAIASRDTFPDFLKLYPKPSAESKPCEVLRTIEIFYDVDVPVKAVLENKYFTAPNAFCPDVDLDSDVREYNVTKIKTNEDCKYVTFKASNEEGSIEVEDFRPATCEVEAAASVIVVETVGKNTTKYYTAE